MPSRFTRGRSGAVLASTIAASTVLASTVLLAGLLAALAALPAAPAAAHGSGPVSDAPYYETTLTGVDSPPRGVSFRVDQAGEWIELTSTSPAGIVVLGYLGEPYLRVTPAGVEENTLSPTVKINQSLFTDALPQGAPPGKTDPVWKRTSATPSVRWHDHRIHWMGGARPPKVAADPVRAHLIGQWTVYAQAAGQPVTVHGTLRWTGKPDDPFGVWVIRVAGIGLVLALITVGVILRGRRWAVRPPAGEAAAEPEPVAR